MRERRKDAVERDKVRINRKNDKGELQKGRENESMNTENLNAP